ncbi:hypothetical protein [Streptomyces tubercidicus]|uniref:hypothetical protein n=1 Tax=Streptomyces tubercidicus TaxID=47759 RepID=UPI0037B4554E
MAGWPALAATLSDAKATGHSPTALLVQAAWRRELGTTERINDVLVWRLRRMADLPAVPRRPQFQHARSKPVAAPSVRPAQAGPGLANGTPRHP